MGLAYQFVQIDPSCFIPRKNNGVIRGQFSDRIRRNRSLAVHLIHIKNISFFQHLYKPHKDLRGTRCIIHSPVMMIQRNTYCFGYRIQLKTVQGRKKESGHTHRIHIGKIIRDSLAFAVFDDKAHIKVRIMGHHHAALTEFQEFRQHILYGGRIQNHGIIDTCQLFNAERNGHFRIYKRGKTIRDLAFLHFYRANLNDLTGQC